MRILVFGATSGMAQSALREFASPGTFFFLVARNREKLETVSRDLRVRGCEVRERGFDLDDVSRHGSLVEEAFSVQEAYDVVLVAHGTLWDSRRAGYDAEEALRIVNTNYVSVVSLLTWVAARMEPAGAGTIGIISSVAGDRGRSGNYIYGSAKAGVTAFASGLRARLAPAGIHVTTLIPGFVATPMTAHLKQGDLFASAEQAGRSLHRALVKKKDVAYIPFFWRFIMLVIKLIPERLFKRMDI